MIKIGLIEDIGIIKFGLEKFLTSNDDFEMVFSANSYEEYQELSLEKNLNCDLIISDIGLPGISGIEGIKLIKKTYPRTKFLMISVYSNIDNIFNSLCSGAIGFLVKNTPFNEIREHIIYAMNDEAFITPSIAKKLLELNRNNELDFNNTEEQIMQLILKGKPINIISEETQVSETNVRKTIGRVIKKLHQLTIN